MSKFNVHVSRTVFQNISIEVEAEDSEAAEALALSLAEKADDDSEWSSGEPENYYVSETEELSTTEDDDE